jgi:leader peptidase (prepilin peptidase)/N-methyltransferase
VNPILSEGLVALQIPALVCAAGFGALWGSFLNVCIARIPRGMSVVSPPSHCFACGRRVLARDNIPILSYFLLRGRCRHCGAKFSARHALIEALAGVLSALSLWYFVIQASGLPLGMRVAGYAVSFAFSAVMIVLAFIDLDTKRLPDIITLPSVAVFYLGGFAVAGPDWLQRLIGAVAGYAVVRLIADIYYYSTGREGLGLGDGKLLAVVGALLGWKALLPIVFAASFLGVIISIPALVVQRRRQKAGASQLQPAPEGSKDVATSIRRSEVPFGPFLAASAVGYLFLYQPLGRFVTRLLAGE